MFTFGVRVSDEIFRFTGPLIPKGIERPLLGVSCFFFLSEGGPKEVTFFIPRGPFVFLPGVTLFTPLADAFFFLIVLGFGFSMKITYFASSSSYFCFAISISFYSQAKSERS